MSIKYNYFQNDFRTTGEWLDVNDTSLFSWVIYTKSIEFVFTKPFVEIFIYVDYLQNRLGTTGYWLEYISRCISRVINVNLCYHTISELKLLVYTDWESY